MRTFTIRHVYNDKTSETLAEARASKWRVMKRKSTLRIPPDEDSHMMKVKRANYQVYVLKNFAEPDAPPSPLDHGWCIQDGKCVPLRYSKPARPTHLRQLVLQCLHEDSDDDDTDNLDAAISSTDSESDSDHQIFDY